MSKVNRMKAALVAAVVLFGVLGAGLVAATMSSTPAGGTTGGMMGGTTGGMMGGGMGGDMMDGMGGDMMDGMGGDMMDGMGGMMDGQTHEQMHQGMHGSVDGTCPCCEDSDPGT